jgi:hypothetical protein
MVFQRFKKWIDEMNVLSGFDLTEKLLHELFSDLDSHKKGYLTENDWTNAFLHYDWQQQMVQEVSEALKTNFAAISEAIRFFQQDSNEITKETFANAIRSLFPKRFIENDINTLWQKIAKNGALTHQ